MGVIEEIKSLAEVPIGKSLLLLITYLANLFLNVPGSFNAFADAMKAQFNMTQTQVTVIEATLMTSSMFLVPAALIYNACSIVNTSLVFLLLTCLGWTSVWLCVSIRNHLIGYSGVIAIAMAIAGHARSYVSVLSNVYMKTLVDSKHHQLFIASIDLIQQIGIFLISLTYESLYINGHSMDTENQSLESYMLLALIIETIVGCLWAVALPLGQLYQRDNLEGDDRSSTITNVKKTTKKLSKTSNKQGEMSDTTCSSSLSSKFPLPFLFILASTAVPAAIMTFQSSNISYITRSLSLVSLNYFLIISYRICTITGKLLLYLVIFLGRKYAYINEITCVILSVLFIICQVLYLIKGTDPTFFSISYIISCTLLGGFRLLMTLLLNNYYENHNFCFKYSCAWSFVCILLAVLQIAFGGLYDLEIPRGGGQYCYGFICLINIFILTTACGSVAPISATVLFLIKYRLTNVNTAL